MQQLIYFIESSKPETKYMKTEVLFSGFGINELRFSVFTALSSGECNFGVSE